MENDKAVEEVKKPDFDVAIGRIVTYLHNTGHGSAPNKGLKVLPAIIVKVWSATVVNLTVFGDHTAPIEAVTLAVTSSTYGDGNGQWLPYNERNKE